MPQQRGGYRIPEYKPFFGKMMQGISQTVMGRQDRERTERIQAEKNKAAQAAWMGDPSAMAELQEIDPQLAMQVEDQRIERETATRQTEMAETTAKTKKQERFGQDLQRAMQQIAQFPDFASAQAFGQQVTDRMVEQYPEIWEQHGMPLEFDEEAFKQIKTRAGPQPLQEQPPVRKTTMIEEVGPDGKPRQRLIYDDTGESVVGPSGEEAVFGAKPVTKTAKADKDPTAEMFKAAGFLGRMYASQRELDRIAKDYPNFNPASKAELTQGFFEAMASSEMQQYRQAAMDWIRAKLRKESGAVIGEQEAIDEYKTYFPVLGNPPEVIEQKKRARKVAEKAMLMQADRAWKEPEATNVPGSSEANPLIATETDTKPPAGSWVQFPDGDVRQI